MRTRWPMLITWAVAAVGLAAMLLTYCWYRQISDSEDWAPTVYVLYLAVPYWIISVAAWMARGTVFPAGWVLATGMLVTGLGLLFANTAYSEYLCDSEALQQSTDITRYPPIPNTVKCLIGAPAAYGLSQESSQRLIHWRPPSHRGFGKARRMEIGFAFMLILQAPLTGISFISGMIGSSQRRKRADLDDHSGIKK